MLLGSFSASINRNELPLTLLHSHCRVVMGYSHCSSLLSQGVHTPYSSLMESLSQARVWRWDVDRPPEQGVRGKGQMAGTTSEELYLQVSQRDLRLV